MEGIVKDYRVKIQIKNNYLLTAMDRAGIESIAELARRCKRSPVQLYGFVNLTLPATKETGEWRDVILDAALVLRCLPEDLMPPQHVARPLVINSGEMEMGLDEVKGIMGSQFTPTAAIPDLRIEREEAFRAVRLAVEGLEDPRHREMITRVHGLDGDPPETFTQIGVRWDRSVTRVSQIYSRGMRALRHPSRSGKLRVALESMFTTDDGVGNHE